MHLNHDLSTSYVIGDKFMPLANLSSKEIRIRHTNNELITKLCCVVCFGLSHRNVLVANGWDVLAASSYIVWMPALQHPRGWLDMQYLAAATIPYVWPQLTTPKLGELRSQLLPMQSTLFLILRSSSMSELLIKIKNGVDRMGRSQEQSSPNLEVGQWESCGYFHLRILKFWWCHQWHVNRI